MTRPTAFELVLGHLMTERFPAIRAELDAAGSQVRDRDGFVLSRSAVTLLRELRPDQEPGESIDEFVSFVHGAFVFAAEGSAVVEMDRDTLVLMLRDVGPTGRPPAQSRAYYLELPEQRVWGEPIADSPPEPLEACFVVPNQAGIEVLGFFGMHPTRPGLTVARVAGLRDVDLRRPDGSALFASRLEGGARAGLFSLGGAAELLELAHRAHAILAEAGAGPGRQRVTIA